MVLEFIASSQNSPGTVTLEQPPAKESGSDEREIKLGQGKGEYN
jgi:hypothetical protein